MKQKCKKTLAILLTVIMLVGVMPAAVFGASLPVDVNDKVDQVVADLGSHMCKIVAEPQVGSIGGEWAVLGLARSKYAVPANYYPDYYKTVEAYVKACGGVLHEKKYTEYSRLIVALTSIGKNPADVGGYNLLTPLGDYNKTIWQGLNGPIWALIALDSGDYPMPQNKKATMQATREMYINRILECQLSDGGFSLFGGTKSAEPGNEVSDPDITGMALQALAKYQDRADVKKVTKEALACMSKMQNTEGGFSSWGTANSESVTQIIVALTELGIPLNDSRFVKNGKSTVDNLLTFYKKEKGFLHTADGSGENQMAVEQGFYGLVAVQRAEQGRNSLYRMSDAVSTGSVVVGDNTTGQGLKGKNADVKAANLILSAMTFDDVFDHKNQKAIDALARRGIISGKTKTLFDPNATMTRAEFAAIVVNALGLIPKSNDQFKDVSAKEWYAPFVGTAGAYSIVSGKGDGIFQPEGNITKQEAACMVVNAAKLCGMDVAITDSAARNIISQFSDYVSSDSWARQSLGFCYRENILPQSDALMQPKVNVKRGEIVQMLYVMLGEARLLQ